MTTKTTIDDAAVIEVAELLLAAAGGDVAVASAVCRARGEALTERMLRAIRQRAEYTPTQQCTRR